MAANNNAGYGREIDQTGYGLSGTGLLSNRNDIRQAMALRLLDNQVPASIPGAGPTAAVALGGIAKAFAMGKLLSDSQDERDQNRADMLAGKETEKGMADDFAKRRLAGPAPAADAPTALAAATPAAPDPSSPIQVPDGFTDRLVGAESGGNPTASNSRSSARGAGQFINSTWLGLARQHEPDATAGKSDADVLAMRTDPALSRRMVGHYATDNGQALQAAGLSADPGNLSLAHNFGPGGATKLLQAAPGALVSATLGPDVIRANPELRGLTNSQAIGIHQQRMAGLAAAPAPAAAPDGGGQDDPFAGAGAGSAPAAPAAGVRPTGPALAARLDAGTGNSSASAPGQPTGPQLAARLNPASVAEMERYAAEAAASPYGMISRQAPGLMADARQARAQLERQQQLGDARTVQQQRDGERASDRADLQGQRAQDAAERQRMALDARVPPGYRWNADRTGMEFVPGGPQDPRNLAPPKPEGSAFGNSADGHALDIMNRLGSKYRDGSASPDERQLYETAATHYTQPKAQVTERGVVQITPQLPPGMPAPGQFGPQAAPQQQAGQGAAPGPASTQPGPTGSPAALPGTTPVPGVRVVQNDQRDPPEKMLGAMLGNVDAVRRTQGAMDSLNGNPGAVGPGLQLFPNLANWFDPNGTTTRAMVADIGSLKLHDRSGAAITASEMPRLIPFIPSIGDTKAAAMDKLAKFQNEYRSTLADQYEVHGPKSGYRTLGPVERILNPADPAAVPAPGPLGAAAQSTAKPPPDPAAQPARQGQSAAPAPSRVPAPPPGFRIIGGG